MDSENFGLNTQSSLGLAKSFSRKIRILKRPGALCCRSKIRPSIFIISL